MVDGGAYGTELAEEVVRDGAVSVAGRCGGLEVGGEVVEGEDVRGDHGHEEEEVQAHGETHRRDFRPSSPVGYLIRLLVD